MSERAPLDVWLAAGTAIGLVLGCVAIAIVPLSRERMKVLLALAAWVALDVALGALGLFAAASDRTVPGIVAGIFAPILCGAWLLGRSGGLRRLVDSIPLDRLIGCQIYRVAGALFILAWAQGRLPGVFALPAGLGDIAVGVSAPVVAARVRRSADGWRELAHSWNVLGLADLVMAVTLGALTSPSTFHPSALGAPGYMTSRLPLVLIPVFAVPVSALLHLATFRRLRRPVLDPVTQEPETIRA
jgi:hypothetical protein